MKLISTDFEDEYHERFLYRERANSQRNRQRLKLLRAHKPGGSLLELGCGSGGLLLMAEKYYTVEGIDISHSAVNSLIAHFGERVRVANIEKDALPARRYDLIAAFNIFEHLHRPERALAEIFDALRDGGILAGSVPLNASLIGRLVTRFGSFFDRTHVSTLVPAAWRGKFKNAGFGDVAFFGEIPFGRNRCAYLRGGLWSHLSFNLMFVCKRDPS